MKIEIEAPYCVYRQTYKNGQNYINYGAIKSAFVSSQDLATVEILGFHNSVAAARRAANALAPSHDAILCHQTGAVYRTIEEACGATGLSRVSISGHLNGRPGFAAPKGFTFQWFPKELL